MPTILKKVLLAEDDPDIQKVAKMSLKFAGVTDVVVVENGEECVAAANRDKPDVILLDVMMPKMDGYEACRRLKDTPETKDIPIIFLTAKAQQFEVKKGMSLGACGYLTKPFNPMSLHAEIVALLEQAKKS
jgi:CheY-like chemotaxis protein